MIDCPGRPGPCLLAVAKASISGVNRGAHLAAAPKRTRETRRGKGARSKKLPRTSGAIKQITL
jgi:hypothetical protein